MLAHNMTMSPRLKGKKPKSKSGLVPSPVTASASWNGPAPLPPQRSFHLAEHAHNSPKGLGTTAKVQADIYGVSSTWKLEHPCEGS